MSTPPSDDIAPKMCFPIHRKEYKLGWNPSSPAPVTWHRQLLPLAARALHVAGPLA